MARYTDEFGPNVQQILCGGTRVVRGRIPARVRRELNAAVKAGALGHLKKDGLKPEVFFHPDHKHLATYIQQCEAEYSASCIAQVMARPEEYVDERARIEAGIFGARSPNPDTGRDG